MPPRTLPPDIIIQIIKYLPISGITNVAAASRRFKVLAYDDEIWEEKLKIIGLLSSIAADSAPDLPFEPLKEMDYSDPAATALAALTPPPSLLQKQPASKARIKTGTTLSAPSSNSHITLMDIQDSFMVNNKPISSLIPGLVMDPFTSRARSRSTGEAREKFKEQYIELIPYYIDFRQGRGESKRILREFGSDPIKCARMLARLKGLGACTIVEDWKLINSNLETTCEYFESASLLQFELAYDANDVQSMKKYATVLIDLNGGQSCIQTFVQKHPMFFDNPFDPLDNLSKNPPDFAPLKDFMDCIDSEINMQATLISEIFPPSADVYFVFAERMFEDVVTEYIMQLLNEAHHRTTYLYLESASRSFRHCSHIVDVLCSTQPISLDRARAEAMVFKVFEPVMADYLAEELVWVRTEEQKKVDMWNRQQHTARNSQEKGLTPGAREVNKRRMMTAFRKLITLPVDLVSSAATTVSSTVVSTFSSKSDRSDRDFSSTNSPTSDITSAKSFRSDKPGSHHSSPSVSSVQSSRTSKEFNPQDLQGALIHAQAELDQLVDLLSVEMALQMIHINKDAERRVSGFSDIGGGFKDGKVGEKIQRSIESIFITLLKILGPQHIQTGFKTAIEHLKTYKPSPVAQPETQVTPLTEFFELVHIADLIQQMVHVYYEEEICRHVDKNDPFNEVNKEKRVFERLLDDCVATGFDQAIQVLIGQVDFILSVEQRIGDFCPSSTINDDGAFDIKPTKACLSAITCLSSHTKILVGSTEKQTLDVFFQEIGRRFFEVLSKHIKKQTINEKGGFQLICDLNAYHTFSLTLRQSTIAPYFAALKSIANIYIISSPEDIKSIIHDIQRFNGVMKVEDLYEFAQSRSDWSLIRKRVEAEKLDCLVM